MDNKDIYMELLDIGYQQDQTMKMLNQSASILQSLADAASKPVVQQELPNIVVPDTVEVNNFPALQKVEVVNQEKVELGRVESLLTKLIQVVPTIKDDKTTESVNKLLALISQDKSKEKVLELLTQILQKEYPMYQLPENLISKEGRIKVEVDRAGGGGGSTKEVLDSIAGNYALKMVEAGPVIYLGKAEPSALTSQPRWQIKKIDQTTGIIITWADGNDLFDNVFDDYLTKSYS